MRAIRSKDTGPELRVRRLAHRLGYRYRLHRADLPGKPDLVFPGRRKVIFVHGCFWHCHPGCRYARKPKTRLDYWLPKLERNVQRDKDCLEKVTVAGWQTLVIWECETGNEEHLTERLIAFLGD